MVMIKLKPFLCGTFSYYLSPISLYRGSGYAGLACMRSVQEMDDGTKRIRPLLHISKDRLLATCTASSIPYVIDPSNSDLQYDRNRVRYGVKQIRDDNLMNTESILDVIDYLQVVCLVLPNDC